MDHFRHFNATSFISFFGHSPHSMPDGVPIATFLLLTTKIDTIRHNVPPNAFIRPTKATKTLSILCTTFRIQSPHFCLPPVNFLPIPFLYFSTPQKQLPIEFLLLAMPPTFLLHFTQPLPFSFPPFFQIFFLSFHITLPTFGLHIIPLLCAIPMFFLSILRNGLRGLFLISKLYSLLVNLISHFHAKLTFTNFSKMQIHFRHLNFLQIFKKCFQSHLSQFKPQYLFRIQQFEFLLFLISVLNTSFPLLIFTPTTTICGFSFKIGHSPFSHFGVLLLLPVSQSQPFFFPICPFGRQNGWMNGLFPPFFYPFGPNSPFPITAYAPSIPFQPHPHSLSLLPWTLARTWLWCGGGRPATNHRINPPHFCVSFSTIYLCAADGLNWWVDGMTACWDCGGPGQWGNGMGQQSATFTSSTSSSPPPIPLDGGCQFPSPISPLPPP